MKEIWKWISGYEDSYEISNYGRIKSHYKLRPAKILNLRTNKNGYKRVALCNGAHKDVSVHSLVWNAFGDQPRGNRVIDHIDNNPSNNRIDNLQLLSNRENISKGIKLKKHFPIGVSRSGKKYKAEIRHNYKLYYLGSYDTLELASQAYQNKLAEINGEVS